MTYDAVADVIEALPTQLRTMRRARGLTSNDVGRLVGIDGANIRRIEVGAQMPSSATLLALLRLLATLDEQEAAPAA